MTRAWDRACAKSKWNAESVDPMVMDTGVELITADPVDGVESKDAAFGEKNCWG